MAARTGKLIWRFRAGAFETSPLVIGRTLYAGSWDHKLYAIDIYTGKPRWTFTADHEINSSPAFSGGRIYFGTDGGSLYSVDARRTSAAVAAQALARFGRREYFYATPTIAYGRVFIGNADGTLYAFGASSGRLLWAQQAGTYIYTAAAVWRRRCTSGRTTATSTFDAATGDRLWRFSASAAIHGAPSVIDGLVYFAACPRCGSVASRYAKQDRGTYALDALTGKLVWHWPDGVFSPAVADSQHLYIAGRSGSFSFAPKRRAQRKQARKRRAARSKARSSTSSGNAPEIEQDEDRASEAGGAGPPLAPLRPRSQAVSGSHTRSRAAGTDRTRTGPRARPSRRGSRQAVADDPVGLRAVRDRVLPEGARIGDRERQDPGDDDERKNGAGPVEHRAGDCPRQHRDDEERHGHECELLQQDRAAERRRREQVARGGRRRRTRARSGARSGHLPSRTTRRAWRADWPRAPRPRPASTAAVRRREGGPEERERAEQHEDR